MHKVLLSILILLVITAAGMTIGQVWGPFMAWDLYIKAVITISILVVLLAFLMVVKADLGQHRKLKDENYLD